MGERKINEIIDIGSYIRHATVHRRYGVTLTKVANTLTPYGAKVLIGSTCCAAIMLTCEVAAKDKDFVLLQRCDDVGSVKVSSHGKTTFVVANGSFGV